MFVSRLFLSDVDETDQCRTKKRWNVWDSVGKSGHAIILFSKIITDPVGKFAAERFLTKGVSGCGSGEIGDGALVSTIRHCRDGYYRG